MTIIELKAMAQQLAWPFFTQVVEALEHLDQQNTGNAERLAKAMEREEALKKEHAEAIAKLQQNAQEAIAKVQAENKLLTQAKSELTQQLAKANETIANMLEHPDVKSARRAKLVAQIQQLYREHDALIPADEPKAE